MWRQHAVPVFIDDNKLPIIFSLLVWLVLMFKYVHGDPHASAGEYFLQDETLQGHRLQNSLIRTLATFSLIDCSLECVREVCCTSINYRIKDSSNVSLQDNCELCKPGSLDKSENLIKDEMFFHFELLTVGKGENFCCSSPCLYGSACDSVSKKCLCSKGFVGRYCGEAKSCKKIHLYDKNAKSANYWINPNPNVTQQAFMAYCDMVTDGGGWTLVYKYTFTNYTYYYKESNAVTPRPDWPAIYADVTISTQAPVGETLGAISFQLWQDIGHEFMITSNINDWIVCQPDGGSIVMEIDGDIVCRNIKNVATDCEGIAPIYIDWGGCGPRVRSETSYYRFDGSRSQCYPTHDPCDDRSSTKHHKKNVPNPGGAIYLR